MPTAYQTAHRDDAEVAALECVPALRDEFGKWLTKRRRRPVCTVYTGRNPRGSAQGFLIFNWTEFDAWQYVVEEALEVQPIHLADRRDIAVMAAGEHGRIRADDPEAVTLDRKRQGKRRGWV
jgi:hypothetical protein